MALDHFATTMLDQPERLGRIAADVAEKRRLNLCHVPLQAGEQAAKPGDEIRRALRSDGRQLGFDLMELRQQHRLDQGRFCSVKWAYSVFLLMPSCSARSSMVTPRKPCVRNWRCEALNNPHRTLPSGIRLTDSCS